MKMRKFISKFKTKVVLEALSERPPRFRILMTKKGAYQELLKTINAQVETHHII